MPCYVFLSVAMCGFSAQDTIPLVVELEKVLISTSLSNAAVRAYAGRAQLEVMRGICVFFGVWQTPFQP